MMSDSEGGDLSVAEPRCYRCDGSMSGHPTVLDALGRVAQV